MERGVLPLAHMVDLLARRRFNDWLCIEDFSTELNDLQKLPHNLTLVQRWLSRTAHT